MDRQQRVTLSEVQFRYKVIRSESAEFQGDLEKAEMLHIWFSNAMIDQWFEHAFLKPDV